MPGWSSLVTYHLREELLSGVDMKVTGFGSFEKELSRYGVIDIICQWNRWVNLHPAGRRAAINDMLKYVVRRNIRVPL